MSTKEYRLHRGRRRANLLLLRAVSELRDARLVLGISQSELSRALGVSQSTVWRTEANQVDDLGVVRLSEMASILGLELALSFHPLGDPIRDKGQHALGKRFDGLLSSRWRVTSETLLPLPGDLRSWDRAPSAHGHERATAGRGGSRNSDPRHPGARTADPAARAGRERRRDPARAERQCDYPTARGRPSRGTRTRLVDFTASHP